MSEQRMKILKMLEEGKITVDEASQLLSKVEELEDKEPVPEPGPRRHSHVEFEGPRIPRIPHIPDVGRIVNDALATAFSEVGHFGFSMGEEQDEPVGPMSYRGARFHGARLEHTDLTDAKMDSRTRFEGADLRYATLVDADLRGADLRGADLSYSDFTDAKLNDADMRGARLSKGVYVDADFRNADLHGADLSMSDLTDADFKNVKEPGLVLRGVAMVGVKFYAAAEEEGWEKRETAAEQAEARAGRAEAAVEEAEAHAAEAESDADAWEERE